MGMMDKVGKLFGKKAKTSTSGRTITAQIPSGRVLLNFVPLKDFFSEDFHSQYTQGMKYSLREGNTKLAEFLPQWQKAHLVTIL